ncbi:MAG: hypothetical protein ACMZI0_00295 [Symbiopectobacterium sp.]|uniref:RNA polymerase factor sigma-54 n=1 Tax=Symbiopectobacterium sp. TaxID=2952789 RepID=UPI0039EA1DD7
MDSVDTTGYLTVPLEDILESIGGDEVTLEEVEAVLKRVQRFDPVGVAARDLRDCMQIQLSQFAPETPWLAEAKLITDSVPRLQVNQQYAALGHSARNDSASQFIRSHLQEARWLIKSLESRNDTLLKVTRYIVEQQQDFFEKGEEVMKPMALADIAQAVDMHESTIITRHNPEISSQPTRHFRTKIFLLQPCKYRQRR